MLLELVDSILFNPLPSAAEPECRGARGSVFAILPQQYIGGYSPQRLRAAPQE